jgi:hypothetical protein
MRFLLIALTLTASTALAQTTGTIALAGTSNETSYQVGKNSCADTRIVNWTVNTTGTLCADLEFWLVAGTSCSDDRGSNELLQKVEQSTLLTTRSGQVSFKVSELPAFKGTSAIECPAADRQDEYRLCAATKLGSAVIGDVCSSTSPQKKDFQVIYDAKPPDAPSIDKVAALDEALSVRVSVPDDANRLKVHVERQDGTGSRNLEQSSDQPLFRVENLENNVTYVVTATAVDSADNESDASEAQTGTPIHTLGFFDRYVDAGGQEMGGCGAAAGGLTGGGVLAVLGLWLSSRRKRS